MERTFNKTKIIATIGPASSSKDVLRQMIIAGVNVCRINSSHGTYEHHQQVIEHVRQINEENDFNTAILVDLQGPKLRIGNMENDQAELKEQEEIIITTDECIGNEKKIYITYPDFPKDVAIGIRF
jgi:pyruvate kinase